MNLSYDSVRVFTALHLRALQAGSHVAQRCVGFHLVGAQREQIHALGREAGYFLETGCAAFIDGYECATGLLEILRSEYRRDRHERFAVEQPIDVIL